MFSTIGERMRFKLFMGLIIMSSVVVSGVLAGIAWGLGKLLH
jgi:hypothetical protein